MKKPLGDVLWALEVAKRKHNVTDVSGLKLSKKESADEAYGVEDGSGAKVIPEITRAEWETMCKTLAEERREKGLA